MSRVTAHRSAWWLLVALTITTLVTKVVVEPTFGEQDLLFLAYLSFGPVGALVAYRRPENAIGWVFLFVGLLAAVTTLSNSLVVRGLEHGPPYGASVALPALLLIALFSPLLLLSTAVTFLLYPSGLPSARWRPVLWLALALMVGSSVLLVLNPTLTVDLPGGGGGQVEINNPLSPAFVDRAVAAGRDSAFLWNLIFPVFFGLTVACIATAVFAAVRRTWRSRGVERLQMRLFASAIALLALVLWPAQYLATHGHSAGRYLLLAGAFALIPASCGVAILRYRLYDIDRIIGRTAAYVIVTGVLLAVYVTVVTSLTTLVPTAGATGEPGTWTVAVATLVAAALFRPVLRWAQRWVARRFNREQYDAERAVDAFAVRLRAEVAGDQVRQDLLSVLSSTVQPRSAGLWLRESAP